MSFEQQKKLDWQDIIDQFRCVVKWYLIAFLLIPHLCTSLSLCCKIIPKLIFLEIDSYLFIKQSIFIHFIKYADVHEIFVLYHQQDILLLQLSHSQNRCFPSPYGV